LVQALERFFKLFDISCSLIAAQASFQKYGPAILFRPAADLFHSAFDDS